MTISLFDKKTGYIECKLCPHRCMLRAGESGKCSIRKCDGDTIFLSNYGELVSIAVNPIEKKPFRCFLPKTDTLSVGGVGCSLRCAFCEQSGISQAGEHPNSKYFSIDYLIDVAKGKNCESICMTFNEPTISFEYLIDLANACHDSDLKFLLKTNAYVNKEPWGAICEVTDAMNIDFKGCDVQYLKITGAKEFVIKDRIKEAYDSGVCIEISIPIYYSFLEDTRIFFQCSQFLGSLDRDIPCHLLKVNPAYDFANHGPTEQKVLDLARDIISFHMNNVFIE